MKPGSSGVFLNEPDHELNIDVRNFFKLIKKLLPAFAAGIALIVAIATDPVLVDVSCAADRTLCICS